MEIDLEFIQIARDTLAIETKVVRLLFGFDTCSDNHSSLISASGEGNFETVKKLLDSFASILEDSEKLPKLNLLHCTKRLIVEKQLKKVYVNEKDSCGQTALMKASSNGCFKIVELLVKYGASAILKDIEGHTAIMLACTHGNVEIVKYLVKDLLCTEDPTNLVMTLQVGAESICIQELTSYQESVDLFVDVKNDRGDTALSLACFNQHTDIVEFLINVGVNVDIQNNNGETALIRACKVNNLEIVKLLKYCGADVYIKSFGQIAIWYVWKKETEIILTLCDKLEKTEEAITMCTSELCSSCAAGNVELVEFLLPLSNVNGIDKNGWTPMHHAAYHNRPDVVKILLETNQVCSPCKIPTPLMDAAYKGHIDVVVLLADSESVCQITEDGATAFLFACIGGHLDIVLYLVEKSDVRAMRCDGLTLLKVAIIIAVCPSMSFKIADAPYFT
ncbi:MAG: ankyrin repeat domain-containing protein, partial [Methylococcales symbiont of Iophon sp. n. MRB-2018]